MSKTDGPKAANEDVEHRIRISPIGETTSFKSCCRRRSRSGSSVLLDAAVSEQIARRVAMKAATESARRHDQEACRNNNTAPGRRRFTKEIKVRKSSAASSAEVTSETPMVAATKISSANV